MALARNALCSSAPDRSTLGTERPEVSVRTLEAKELRQLRAREIERQAGFETDQHGFGEEADRVAGPNQPCGDRNRGHHERGTGIIESRALELDI
jgi:hypothetical protein